LPLSKLAEHPLVLPSTRHSLRILIDTAAAKSRLILNIVIEADSMQVQKDLVRSGLGLTVLPAAAIYDDLRAKQISAAPIAGADMKRRISLALPLVRKRVPAVQRTAELLTDEVRSRVAAGGWPGARLTGKSHI
jgi:DNA-binding transcriptional LysR family regulator